MVVARVVLIGMLVVVTAAIAAASPLFGAHGPVAVDRLQRFFCRALLRLLRIEVLVEGRAAPHGTERLVVANHISWIDILVLGSLEPLCFLAKREVGDWPMIAALAEAQGTIFVDRACRRSIPGANAALAARLRAGRSVVVFPEGTTHDGGRRGRFRTAHLACLRDRFGTEDSLAQCAAQPVGLSYSDAAAAWVGDASLLPHLLQVLRRPPMRCAIVYGTPSLVERGYDRKQLGRDLADRVEALLVAPGPLQRTPHAVTRPHAGTWLRLRRAGR